MQARPSIWGTNNQSSKLPGEYSLKQGVSFYARRVRLVFITLSWSVGLAGIFILATRFTLGFLVGFALVLFFALLMIFSEHEYLLRAMRTKLRRQNLATGDVPNEQIIDGVYVLRLSGKFVAGNSQDFNKRIDRLLDAGHRHILVDLANVGYMDADGISTLVTCFVNISKKGGRIKLLNLNPKLRSLLKFETYDNEGAALAAFRLIGKSEPM